jgi:hypothetical protein
VPGPERLVRFPSAGLTRARSLAIAPRDTVDLDNHPYLAIYLLGCGFVPVLAVTCVAFTWVLSWITKANVVAKNLRKLEPSQSKAPFASRAGKFLATWTAEMALSWISVAVLAWRTVSVFFRTIREIFSSVPEAVRQLRYPLKTNPDLPAESVWAYAYALNIRVGSPPPDAATLSQHLDVMSTLVPLFDRAAALRQLEALDVVKSSTIAAVVAQGDAPADEDE